MKDNKIYQKVYFRISSGYVWGEGMPEEKSDTFHNSIRKFLKTNGFKIDEPKFSSSAISGTRGFESLYCHPQSLSGYIDKTKIDELEKHLKNTKYDGFTYDRMDKYDEVKNYTSDELIEKLKQSKEKIKGRITEIYTTKRSNLYKVGNALFDYRETIKKDLQVSDTGINGRIINASLMETFDEMIESGDILETETKHGKGYRANIKKGGK